MKYEIPSKKAYHETMAAIYDLMNRGENNLSKVELKKLEAMAVAAEKYEDEVLGLKPAAPPKTIIEAVEVKLFENRMTQATLAEKTGLSKSKVSEILTGKRQPDISFLKAIYKVLHIDAEFLLKHA